MKKYSSYKPSGEDYIGDIPNDWECIRLGMLGVFSSSGIDKKTNDNGIGTEYLNYFITWCEFFNISSIFLAIVSDI